MYCSIVRCPLSVVRCLGRFVDNFVLPRFFNEKILRDSSWTPHCLVNFSSEQLVTRMGDHLPTTHIYQYAGPDLPGGPPCKGVSIRRSCLYPLPLLHHFFVFVKCMKLIICDIQHPPTLDWTIWCGLCISFLSNFSSLHNTRSGGNMTFLAMVRNHWRLHFVSLFSS